MEDKNTPEGHSRTTAIDRLYKKDQEYKLAKLSLYRIDNTLVQYINFVNMFNEHI